MNLKIRLLLLLITVKQVSAQNNQTSVLSQRITIVAKDEPVRIVLQQIERQTGKSFSYDSKMIDSKKRTSVSVKEKTITEVISILFNNTVSCKVKGNYIVLYKKLSPPVPPYSMQSNQRIKKGLPSDSRLFLKPSKTRNDTTVRYFIDIIVPTASGKDSVIQTESIEVPTTHILQIKDDTTIILLKKDTVTPD